ncbi:DUF6691 family protein [Bacteriovorax sp. Seq25_V]|uniref:DUF6691 family protein n=1 Tax=Bacteriovorax sp. Seq25_V TaxID=1201288 RepID=UPI00038A4F12|nr:DUF6691 family protein [Bacteriovorax sp. Seq25_V]EQC43747.1 sulfur transport [Bacteriovorax sp. Seq25_V]
MKKLYSLLSGLIFGIGLGLSGMMSPEKVKGFLNITREWDPSLALVMGGALLITFVAFPLVLKKSAPICEDTFFLPTKKELDLQVIAGPILFGIGWGLIGLCPGPAIANIATGATGVIAFFFIMAIAMYFTDLVRNKLLN